MKPKQKRRISSVLIAACLVLALSVTSFAAWKLLNPGQVAGELGDKALAHAFEEKNAVRIDETQSGGGYDFTFLGIVSGEGISDFTGSAAEIHPNRTYAVLSIAKTDGSPMPASGDEAYGETPFFISPLINGTQPWLYNIASMGGNYSELVKDGVLYRLIECDGVEIFADRGLQLCIISNSAFYTTEAFDYNEETGKVTPKAEYDGANLLFDLPLDPSKADPEAAQTYLDTLWEQDDDTDDGERTPAEEPRAENEAQTVDMQPSMLKTVTE